MVGIQISDAILDKLTRKHGVTRKEVEQCFENRERGFLLDTREDHKTNPATQWFIAETNKRRLLKIVFIKSGNCFHLKTAYEPNPLEIHIYKSNA
jgi:uncharacterized DUF497 family protein